MDGAQTSRPAPRVIRVPPPVGEVVSTRVMHAAAIAGGVAALIVAVSVGGTPAWITGLVALGLGGFFFWLPRWANAGYRRKRAEFLDTLEQTVADPLLAAVAATWERPTRLPKPEEIRAAVRAADDSNPPRAHVVCLGMVDVPEVGAAFFEPEIITPTRAIGSHLWFVPIAAALVALWLLQILGVIPGRVINIGSFGYILAMGASAAGMWVWRSAIRPTYIRMAPGVVQVMEYHHGRGKPNIRSYPLDGGTLALMRGPITGRKRLHLTLTLLHDEQKDALELWRMRRRDAIVERTWQALLSTAPTPPLSDEELIG